MSTKRDTAVRLLIAAWLVIVGSVGTGFWRYASTEGAAAQAPERWPNGSSLARSEKLPTLLMFAHPRCPCTRASLHELARLLRGYGDRVLTQVVLIDLGESDPAWRTSDLVAQARSLKGARIAFDKGGREATRFGSLTSGQVLLYRQSGELAFRGGVTQSRGHEGTNLGSERIASLLRGEPARSRSPVFGCELKGPKS